MKNQILFVAFFLMAFSTMFAQSPIIEDFRKIIADGPSQFSNLQSDLFQENDGFKFYHSTIESSPISTVYIQVKEQELPLYVMDFKVEEISTQMLGLFMNMVEQYIAELNDMVKSGLYTGEDYTTDDGKGVTELRNLNNDIVVQYVSSDTNHDIYFFGLPK